MSQQLIEGMNVLYLNDILHRDLKFENILVHNGVLKIADFGLARQLDDNLQVETARGGTPYTMAP
jgi:serine/threonine protein kinase